MQLKGYIQAFKENSFTIPVYSDGEFYYYHSLNDNFEITGFYKAEFPNECFKKAYLSKQFIIGEIGAIVFVGIDYISYNQADKNINEIINYLNDTTIDSVYLNIKMEALEVKQIFDDLKSLHRYQNIQKDTSKLGEEISNPNIEINSAIIKYKLEDFIDLENNIITNEEINNSKEIIIKKYLEKLIFDKNLYSSNKEIVFFLLRKYLEDDQTAFEEIIFDSNISNGFSSYLTSTSDIFISPVESPVETSIEKTLRLRADERRNKLKTFNYRFHNSISNIEEMQKIPAYIRAGVELNDLSKSVKKSAQVIVRIEPKDLKETQRNNTIDKIIVKT